MENEKNTSVEENEKNKALDPEQTKNIWDSMQNSSNVSTKKRSYSTGNAKKIVITVIVCVAILAIAFYFIKGPAFNPDNAFMHLQNRGYLTTGTFSSDDYEGVEHVVMGFGRSNGSYIGGDSIVIYYFEDAEAANNAWEKFQDEYSSKKIVRKFGNRLWAASSFSAVNAAR